jgi:hypothetical protein
LNLFPPSGFKIFIAHDSDISKLSQQQIYLVYY